MRDIEIVKRDIQIAELCASKSKLESENYGLRSVLSALREKEFLAHKATFEAELAQTKRELVKPPEVIVAAAPLRVDPPQVAAG